MAKDREARLAEAQLLWEELARRDARYRSKERAQRLAQIEESRANERQQVALDEAEDRAA